SARWIVRGLWTVCPKLVELSSLLECRTFLGETSAYLGAPMDLFSTLRLGRLELPNRIVMAPMTRSRAIGSVPNDLMRTYYMARASAGLIITEGVAPSPNALGYARIPGLFSSEQIGGWRRVTSAVHEAGGRIFAQLMHTGRIAHPLNQPEGAL